MRLEGRTPRDDAEGRRTLRGLAIGCGIAAVCWVVGFTVVTVWVMSR